MFIKHFRPNFVNTISESQKDISSAHWTKRNAKFKVRGHMEHRSAWVLEQEKC